MPVVPFATPQAVAAAAAPDPTFMAIAANEVITEYRKLQDAPMDPAIIGNRTPEGYKQYEDTVDKFVKDKDLQKGERFRVPGTNDSDPRIYEYLGPNSGGRKDWRELRSKGES